MFINFTESFTSLPFLLEEFTVSDVGAPIVSWLRSMLALIQAPIDWGHVI